MAIYRTGQNEAPAVTSLLDEANSEAPAIAGADCASPSFKTPRTKALRNIFV